VLNIVLALFLFTPPTLVDSPLGLPWGQKLDDTFRIYKEYRYMFGDVNWGTMRFRGEVGENFESELILDFVNSKIASAYLILGPIGLTENNCVIQYNRIVSAISARYGNYVFREIIKESIIDDLIYASQCYPIKVGVAEISTKWRIKNFEIEASIYTDERDILIQIKYVYVPLLKYKKIDLYEHF